MNSNVITLAIQFEKNANSNEIYQELRFKELKDWIDQDFLTFFTADIKNQNYILSGTRTYVLIQTYALRLITPVHSQYENLLNAMQKIIDYYKAKLEFDALEYFDIYEVSRRKYSLLYGNNEELKGIKNK